MHLLKQYWVNFVVNVVNIRSNKEGIESSVETEGEEMERKKLYVAIVCG